MSRPLQGKVALITGSTGGIGAGIASALAEQDCDIMLHGFGEEDAIAAQRAALQKNHSIQTGYSGADLSESEACRALVRETEAALGRVDILVNNAGIQHVAKIEDFASDAWDKVLAVNLSAAFHTTAAAIPGMQARGFGRVINIASAHGKVASAGKAAYVAAKHGLLGLTKVVALEQCPAEAGKDITCNAICPGWVLTPLVQKQIENNAAREGISIAEAERQLLLEKQPAGQFVQPEEVGAMAVYLCSEAARLVNGATLSIDGGWTAQ